MALFVFRKNDVITRPRPFFTCGAKNRYHPITLKITMEMLSSTPDTMAMLVFCENDVITGHASFSPAAPKNRCLPIGLKIVTGKLLHLPRTMAMFVFHENDVIALWAWSRGHTLNDTKKCSLPEQQRIWYIVVHFSFCGTLWYTFHFVVHFVVHCCTLFILWYIFWYIVVHFSFCGTLWYIFQDECRAYELYIFPPPPPPPPPPWRES